MIALVVALAMTTRMEVIRRNIVITLRAGVILVSMVHVVMNEGHVNRTILEIK